MHDLSLKPGAKTSEFLVTLLTVLGSWIATVLALLGDIGPSLPEQYRPWVLIGTIALTASQAVVYNLKRGDLKKAAIGAVVGYNAVAQRVAEAHTTITTDGPPEVTTELSDAEAPSEGLAVEDGSGEIDLDAVDYTKLD